MGVLEVKGATIHSSHDLEDSAKRKFGKEQDRIDHHYLQHVRGGGENYVSLQKKSVYCGGFFRIKWRL